VTDRSPETKQALLMSAGIRKFTWHTWKRTQALTDTSGNAVGYEHVYKCSETGALRRWGLEAMSLGGGE
jgi:hypothetical protein